MLEVKTLSRKKTPYKTAAELCAIFTEFKRGAPERGQILHKAFGGIGRFTQEPRLVAWCGDAGFTRAHLDELVKVLVQEKHLDDFYGDESVAELLSFGLIEKACKAYIEAEVVRRSQPIDEDGVKLSGLARRR